MNVLLELRVENSELREEIPKTERKSAEESMKTDTDSERKSQDLLKKP